jgi:hypothetical protein
MMMALYFASLVPVLWAVTDAARRSPYVLPARHKAYWIVGCAVGWMISGSLGAAIAAVYLVGPRRQMNARVS